MAFVWGSFHQEKNASMLAHPSLWQVSYPECFWVWAGRGPQHFWSLDNSRKAGWELELTPVLWLPFSLDQGTGAWYIFAHCTSVLLNTLTHKQCEVLLRPITPNTLLIRLAWNPETCSWGPLPRVSVVLVDHLCRQSLVTSESSFFVISEMPQWQIP